MFDRLGAAGVLALLVFVGSLVAAAYGARPVFACIVAAAAGIFMLFRLFRSGDA
jgi:hypothetical protein